MDASFTSPPPPPPTTTAVALRYGLLTGLVSTVFTLMLFLTKNEQSSLRWLGLAISIAGIYLAHQEFKKRNGGFMAYGQALSIGTLLSVIAGTISGAVTYVYVTYIDPSYLGRGLDVARAQMEARGDMADADIDTALEISAKFMNGGALLIFSVLGGALFGFILSLIIGAITKNSPPEFE